MGTSDPPGTAAGPPLPARVPLRTALIDLNGPDFARPARAADAVAGRRASYVAVPGTVAALAATLRLAAERGLVVTPRGSGSKIDWGEPPPGTDLLVDTARLGGLWDVRPDAGTAEVGAGTPVRALQAALALRGLRVPVDPPSPGATVGGVLAVNESGPLRYRHGPPADHVAAVGYVDAAGREVRSDGRDGRPGLAEIPGVLTAATVRLAPLPAARCFVCVPLATPLHVPGTVRAVREAAPEAAAIEVDLPAPAVARPAGAPAGTVAVLLEGDADELRERAAALVAAVGRDAAATAAAPSWWGRYPFRRGDVALRVAVPAADLHAAVYALRDAAGGPVGIRGSAGAGSVHAVLPRGSGAEAVGGVVDALRRVLAGRGGRVVIVTAPPPVARDLEMATRTELC